MRRSLIFGLVVVGWMGSGCMGDNEQHHMMVPTGARCEGPEAQTLTYESFGQPFIAHYCTGCHSLERQGSARHGAPADHNFDTVDLVREQMDHIDGTAAAGPLAVNEDMPFNESPTIADRVSLGVWLACGAP